MGFTRNKNIFNSARIVKAYIHDIALQKPEETIFGILAPDLCSMRMLDIGIGTGRTTAHFGPRVASYTGIDYSPSMVEHCASKYSSVTWSPQFICEDVRSLKSFKQGPFDFVLFSFNGIDYISYDERSIVLANIRSACSSHGVFCFSHHNLNMLTLTSQKNKSPLPKIPVVDRLWFAILKGYLQIHQTYSQVGYAALRDSAHRFMLKTMYVSPEKQVEQLKDAGFAHIRIFNVSQGQEFIPYTRAFTSLDPWLYYLCSP